MADKESSKVNVGTVLLKVQDDLGRLKSSLGKFIVDDEGTALNFEALDSAISRTEKSIWKHAEEHLKKVNSELQVLPFIEEQPRRQSSLPHWEAPVKTLPQQYYGVRPSSSITEKQKLNVNLQSTFDRTKKYGITLPKIKEAVHVAKHKGKNFTSGSQLPPIPKGKTNKVSQSQKLPLLIHQKPAVLHQRTELVKTEPSITDKIQQKSPASTESFHVKKQGKSQKVGATVTPPPSTISKSPPQSVAILSFFDITTESTPSPFEDISNDDITFIIKSGQIDTRGAEFCNFKSKFNWCWSNVVDHLEALQDLLRKFAVPVAVVRGKLLANLSFDLDSGWNKSPPINLLLSVLDNQTEVSDIISKPGQRYKGEGGLEAAVILIQSYYRRFMDRNAYQYHLRRKWAGEVFAIAWLLRAELLHTRKALQKRRSTHLENSRTRLQHLAANWKCIKSSRRTIIHIPSLGYPLTHRRSLRNFDVLQNMQISRLFEIKDKNVAVIYVCPLHLGDEILEYYTNLLCCDQATDDAEMKMTPQSSSKRRFVILTPEAVDYFPNHNMCLSTLLKYSPHTLKRIKNLIRGKWAYIVGGIAHIDDLAVADMLDVPILGSHMDALKPCTSKSNARRIFAEADVDFPPGKDVRSVRQFYETLAELLVQNIHVPRWVFKINFEPDPWAKAYCDTCHLGSYKWFIHRYRQHGADVWNVKNIKDTVRLRYLNEIPEWLSHYAQPVKTYKYPNWGSFLKTFLRQGGVVEATPPSLSVTYLTVDMLLEPGGEVTMLSCGDQLYGSCQLEALGSTVPQTSVHPDTLHSVCERVGQTLLQRDIIGYVSLDLATFLDSDTMNQKVWAVDLHIAYSNHLAMTQMLLMLTNGTLNWHTGYLEVPQPAKEKTFEPPTASKAPVINCYGVIGTRLFHSNLFMLYNSSFLYVCRSNMIGFSFKKRRGSVFTLFDITDRCNFGMLTISEDLQGALVTFGRNLTVIHQEISSRIQGETNFTDLLMNIEEILQRTAHNKRLLTENPAV